MPRLVRALLGLLLLSTSGPIARGANFRFGSQTLTVPEGFTVERVAAAPLVNRPIAMDFDEQGRLYVSDSSGSNEKPEKQLAEKPHRIVRLQDTNGDGVYDRQTVYADHMMFPEGVMWLNGSLYVGAPPSIWKLTDTDGDGVADQREEWFQGKTLTGCANDLHGPYLGPDGWIYWCKGAFAKQSHAIPGRPDWSTRAAHIFRARPDGSGLEPIMTGGMDNPVEVAFTAAGEPLFTTTFVHQPENGKRDGVVHAIYGGLYGKPNDVLDGHPHTGELMPVMTLFGAAAPCGLTRYRSEVFGEGFRDNFFATLFNLHKVTRLILEPEGATFKAKTEDFLSSDDPDFHPTDVLEDADGSLLVIDTGGWYKICCPTSQLAKPDVFGAIYRIRRLKTPAIADPRGLKIDWAAARPEDLVKHLTSSRPFVASRAQAELVRRGPDALPALRAGLKTLTDPAARSLLAWTLTRVDSPEARAALRSLINDAEETVAASAIHGAGLWRDQDALQPLLAVLETGVPETRRAAAEALGRIGNMAAAPFLLNAAASPHDRALEHSLIYALIELNNPAASRKALASSGSPHKARAALISLDQMPSGRLSPSEVLPLLEAGGASNSSLSLLRETALWVARHHPEWGSDLAGFLQRQLALASSQAALARVLADFSSAAEVQNLLATLASDASAPEAARRTVLESMSQASLRESPPSWPGAVALALDAARPELLPAALQAARWLASHKTTNAPLQTALLKLGHDNDLPPELRVAALASLSSGLHEVAPALFTFLAAEIAGTGPVIQKKQVAEVLARARLTEPQLLELASKLKQAGPLELGSLLPAFDQSNSEAVGLALVEALQTAKSLSSLRVDQLKPRLEKFGGQPFSKGQAVLALLAADTAQQQSHLEKLLTETKGGDVRRGQIVFNSAKAACATCHAIGYLGGHVGPDLTSIGTIRTERDLLESIVYPSASFVRSYEPMRVTTKGGDDYSGIVKSDSADALVLLTGPDAEVRVARADIADLRPGLVSIMPQGLDQQLTTGELADLLAFLKNTKWGPQ